MDETIRTFADQMPVCERVTPMIAGRWHESHTAAHRVTDAKPSWITAFCGRDTWSVDWSVPYYFADIVLASDGATIAFRPKTSVDCLGKPSRIPNLFSVAMWGVICNHAEATKWTEWQGNDFSGECDEHASIKIDGVAVRVPIARLLTVHHLAVPTHWRIVTDVAGRPCALAWRNEREDSGGVILAQ